MASCVKTSLALVLFSVLLFPFSGADTMLEKKTTWEQTMANADWIKRGIRGKVSELIFKQYRAANVSQSCKESMAFYSKAHDEWIPWAMQMADATANLPAGILAGTRLDFGAYDECLGIRAGALQGRFCMAGFSSPIINSTRDGVEAYARKFGHPPEWIQHYLLNKGELIGNGSLRLGICMPSSCSEEDIHSILSTSFISLKYDVELTDCQVDEPKEIPYNSIVALYGLLSMLTLCVVGTLLDLYYKPKSLDKMAESSAEKESPPVALLKTFSLRLNLYRLYMMSNSDRATFLDFCHGFRVVVFPFQLLSHVIAYPSWRVVDARTGMLRADDYMLGFFTEKAFMENAGNFIDIYFVFSGFLLVFTMWSKLEKNGGYVNVPLFLLKRCFRIFPTFLLMIALLFVAPLLNRGPIWNSTWGEHIQNCENNVWKNFLFISNYWSWKEGQCLLHTWFISALMQIQVVGLFLLLITFRWRKGGIIVSLLAVAGSSLLIFIKSMNFRHVTPTFENNNIDYTLEHYHEFYFNSLAHFGPYVVGMAAGYAVLKYRESVPSKGWQVVGWLGTAASVWWGYNGLALIPPKGAALHISIFYSLSKLFCSMGFAWIVYACAAGLAETLRKCLSWKPLVYLSNLQLCMYLLHPLLIFYKYAVARERTTYDYVSFIYDGLSVMAMGYFLSFIAHLVVESPFAILEWKLLGSETPIKSKPEGEEKKTT